MLRYLQIFLALTVTVFGQVGLQQPLDNRQVLGSKGFTYTDNGNARALRGIAAWYDASDVNSLIYTTGTNAVSLWSDKSGNSGTGSSTSTGLYQTGAAGQYASTPNAAPLQVTGDIDVRAMLSMPTWTPATVMIVISKMQVAGNQCYEMYLDTAGKILFGVSVDGTATSYATSSAATGFSAFSTNWIRATRASVSGTVTFYTSLDGITWNQLGTTQATTAGAIFAGTNTLSIGAKAAGTFPFSGNFLRAQIYNGIGGTLALDANFVGQRTNATSFTESSSNAATVTINGTALLGWVDAANVLVLNAVAGNYASSPDSTALSLSTLLDIRARVQLNDWSPAVETVIVAKSSGAGQSSYIFRVPSTGANLQLVLSNDGTAATQVTSSTTVPFSDLTGGWVRVTWRASDGRVQFFTAADSATMPSSWTQLGTDASIVYASIFDSTAAVEIGARSVGTLALLAGTVGRAQIRNNILDDGTGIVFDANFGTCSKLATSFIESSTNAATVTINAAGATGARVSGARDLYQVIVGSQPILTIAAGANRLTFDGTDDSMKSPSFSFSQPETVYSVLNQLTWVADDFIYDGNDTNSRMILAQKTGTPQIQIYGGSAYVAGISPPLAALFVDIAVFNGASSTHRYNRNATVTASAGTNPGNGITLGSTFSGAFGANFTVSEIAMYAAAHSTSEQNAFATSRMSKWRIP